MKNLIKSLSIFMFLLVVLSSMYSWKNPSNPPLAKTGAPGEGSCQESGCHSGGAFTGTVNIIGIPDTVVSGKVYPFTYEFTTNASRVGYQSVVLDKANANAGTFTAGTGTIKATQATRTYISQSSAKNVTLGTAVSWASTWTAPATITGDSVTFYYNFLAGNGNGGNNGDNAIKGKQSFKFVKNTATTNISFDELGTVYPSPATDFIQIKMNNAGRYNVELFDISGKLILKDILNENKTIDVKNLQRGVVIMKISNDKVIASKKIVLE
jgi:Secretion system C-terminal sorting domain